jgi:colanic acid/amylovoran biosynthesis glycosyltransferase
MVVGVSEKKEIGVPVYYQPILASTGAMRWIYTFWLILKSLIKAPIRVSKLFSVTQRIGYTTWKQWRMVAVLSNFLPLKNVNWVHFAYGTMAVERAFVGEVLGARISMSLRGYDISIAPILRPKMYNQVWPFVSKVHSISNDLLVEAKKHGMPENLPNEIIHPAINTERFKTEIRNFQRGTLKILTVGRLHWKKGLEYTLEALAILNIDFVYTIIGEGEDRERLLFTAHQLGILDKVHFVGKQNQIQVFDAMKKNDMYLQYSVQEGFCNAVLEAQAAGMLCIVSDAEGLGENIEDNETGWIVPKRNSNLLSMKINKVNSVSIKEKKEISKNAQRRVNRLFDIKSQNRQFQDFFS